MKKFSFALAIALAFLIRPVYAEGIVVIVHQDNAQSVSLEDIKNIYEDNVTTWSSGDKISSYHLPTKSVAREGFSQKILGKSAKKSAMDWANKKITNTAKNPPSTKKDILVAALVAKNKNAIGYVPASIAEGKKGIKVILTLE